MRIEKSIRILFLLLCCSAAVYAGGGQKKQKGSFVATDTIELTSYDITKIPSFYAGNASVFNIALGMSIRQVHKIVEAKSQLLKLERDPFNIRRYYLYDVSSDTGKVMLAYLKWPKYDTALMEIALYPSMSKYMQGMSCTIMSGACMNPESDLYKNFLGKPAAESVDVDIPAINLKTTRYWYSKPKMLIEKQQNGDKVVYSMILYKL